MQMCSKSPPPKFHKLVIVMNVCNIHISNKLYNSTNLDYLSDGTGFANTDKCVIMLPQVEYNEL